MTQRIVCRGFVFAFAIIFLASVAYSAVAQEGSTTSPSTENSRGALQGSIEERREEIKENIEERRAEIASTTQEFKKTIEVHRRTLAKKTQERLYNLTHNIKGRMVAAIFRISHIADRIETRTQKLKAEKSVDDARVREELGRVRVALASAEAALSSDLGSFAYDENPREAFMTIRDSLMNARGHIRDAHLALRAAYATLKDASPGIEGSGVSDAVRENSASTTGDQPITSNE